MHIYEYTLETILYDNITIIMYVAMYMYSVYDNSDRRVRTPGVIYVR